MEDLPGRGQQRLCDCKKYAPSAAGLESALAVAGIFHKISVFLQEGHGQDIFEGTVEGIWQNIFQHWKNAEDSFSDETSGLLFQGPGTALRRPDGNS